MEKITFKSKHYYGPFDNFKKNSLKFVYSVFIKIK